MKIRIVLLVLTIVLLICACYAPTQTEGTCISTTYRNCVDAETATWFCGNDCQARCRALAVEVCR